MSFLDISYLLLCGLIIAEWALLRELVHEVAEIRRRLPRPEDEDPLSQKLGERIPRFSAELFGTRTKLTDADLLGKTTVLLFVEPEHAVSSAGASRLTGILHLLWHQFESSICVVCSGPENACARFAQHFGMEGPNNSLRVVLDEEQKLARLFSVAEFPAAFVVSEDGSISKHGTLQLSAAA